MRSFQLSDRALVVSVGHLSEENLVGVLVIGVVGGVDIVPAKAPQPVFCLLHSLSGGELFGHFPEDAPTVLTFLSVSRPRDDGSRTYVVEISYIGDDDSMVEATQQVKIP